MTWGKVAVISGLLVAALGIGFGCGSLWMAARASDARELATVLHSWMSPIELLTHDPSTVRSNPAQVTRDLGWSLDLASVRLAYVYDDLPQGSKDRIRRYANAAHALALAQQGHGVMNDRQHLLIFADCVQKTQSAGESVRECAKQEGMYRRSPGKPARNPPPGSPVADAR